MQAATCATGERCRPVPSRASVRHETRAAALLFIIFAWHSLGAAAADVAIPSACMPHPEDYTHMWWAEGFPAHTPGAPWLRVIQTGSYAVALDTRAMRIVHLGQISTKIGYEDCARTDNMIWQALPSADLGLLIEADGKVYRCVGGADWGQFWGPRIVESGRWVQRADVTHLRFADDAGNVLNVDARFETVAWPDRLALILAARPGVRPIAAGEECFGRIGGGFGLDGENHFEIPHSNEIDPEHLTLEFWAFVPANHRVSNRTFPWLACKNRNEHAEGNYGIVIMDGTPQARMNIGGGRENAFIAEARPGQMKTDAWNHLVLTYDGASLKFYVNGDLSGEREIGRKRVAGRDGLVFGRRQDNSGDGYHFRGAIDEIRVYRRALSKAEVRERFAAPESSSMSKGEFREWGFRPDGHASAVLPREGWSDGAIEIGLTTPDGSARQRWELPVGDRWQSDQWREAAIIVGAWGAEAGKAGGSGEGRRKLSIHSMVKAPLPMIEVAASENPGGAARTVTYDTARGWHCVNLDGIEPAMPSVGGAAMQNDAIERVRLVLSNPSPQAEMARILFEKNGRGFRQRIGAAITGISAILRDPNGSPTGIPVQLSKNWHGRAEGGVYSGVWFHGFSQMRIPARTDIQLELTLCYGHWGGVAAASHAQLCLIGWGSNQLWDQSAVGSWGESICYEPDQAQAQAGILDVRPLMVKSISGNRPWGWTHNVGGGDFFRLFDPGGNRMFPGRMRTAYSRHGPCLTEVTYAGRTADVVEHAATVSLGRTDDLVRGTYRLRMDVKKPIAFSRFVIFQIGADSYSYARERRMALGDENGMTREWKTQWGGDVYRMAAVECGGRVPWVSLHDAARRPGLDTDGALANRGLVIRSWDARLGGRKASPWVAERGARARGEGTSTADVLPPPDVNRLEPGDFVDATIQHIIVPQYATDYYGPNKGLKAALEVSENTWALIHREAVGNDRAVAVTVGNLEALYPAVRVRATDGRAECSLKGGAGYVPVTFAGVPSAGGVLSIDGKPLDQTVHGRDFWQADYDPRSGTWEITFSIPEAGGKLRHLLFECRRQ